MERLSIGAVARMTGLSEFTLRAWERRYNGLTPERLKSGRRVYTLEDVERLNLVGQLLAEGHKVGQIIQLESSKLAELIRHRKGSAASQFGPGVGVESARSHAFQMLEAVHELNVSRLTSLLKTCQMQFNTSALLIDIVALFLRELGHSVANGRLDVFHEHAASAAVRNFLTGMLFSTEQVAKFIDRPPIVFAAPEGEHHEFGILITAILAAMRSFPVFYLGPNMPVGSLERAARKTNSPLVVVGLTVPEATISDSILTDYLAHLSRRLEGPAQIWVGGPRAAELKIRRDLRSIRKISSLNEFDRNLSRLSG